MDIRKVVIPVAGWGTRSLPATKNLPKEMLPIYRKPIIQYVVEEALEAGIPGVVFITNQTKRIIEDHFDHNLLLEDVLRDAGKTEMLEEICQVAEMVDFICIRQKRQLGLGHAVLCAREACQHEPFAVMLGDDLLFGPGTGLSQLIEVARTHHTAVVGVIEVPKERVSRYGIIDGIESGLGVYQVHRLVEKPQVQDAPSNLAIIGRYVLLPEIFDILEHQQAGVGGEIQLTDALQGLADQGKLLAVKMRGQRFDAGDWVEYLMANLYAALQDRDMHDDLLERMRLLLASQH